MFIDSGDRWADEDEAVEVGFEWDIEVVERELV